MVIRGRRGREQTPRACLAPMSRASHSLTPHSPGLILLRGKLRPKRCCDFPMSLNKGKGKPGGALRARVSIYRAPTVYKCCLSGVGPPSPGQQHQGLRVYPHTHSCLVPSLPHPPLCLSPHPAPTHRRAGGGEPPTLPFRQDSLSPMSAPLWPAEKGEACLYWPRVARPPPPGP